MTLRLEAFSCRGQREECLGACESEEHAEDLSFCALCHCCKLHPWPSWHKKLSHMIPRCQYPWTQVSRGSAGRGSASSTDFSGVVQTAKSPGIGAIVLSQLQTSRKSCSIVILQAGGLGSTAATQSGRLSLETGSIRSRTRGKQKQPLHSKCAGKCGEVDQMKERNLTD